MSNVLFAICMAVVIVGTIETTYQIYKLIILDASARGLKHPKLWGLLATSGNNSSGLLLYLMRRRQYPIKNIDDYKTHSHHALFSYNQTCLENHLPQPPVDIFTA